MTKQNSNHQYTGVRDDAGWKIDVGQFDGYDCPGCKSAVIHSDTRDIGNGRTFDMYWCCVCDRDWFRVVHTKTGRLLEWGLHIEPKEGR